MSDYNLLLTFEDNKYIDLEDLPHLVNYICHQLISWSPNRAYYEPK